MTPVLRGQDPLGHLKNMPWPNIVKWDHETPRLGLKMKNKCNHHHHHHHLEKHPPPKKNRTSKTNWQHNNRTTYWHFFEVVKKKALHNCHKADKVIGLWRCSFIVDLYCKFWNKLPIVNQSFARNSQFVWMARQRLSRESCFTHRSFSAGMMSLKAAVPTSQKRVDFNQKFQPALCTNGSLPVFQKRQTQSAKRNIMFSSHCVRSGLHKTNPSDQDPSVCKKPWNPNLETIQNDISWRKNVYFELSCCNFGIQIRLNGETGIPIGSLDRSADVDIFTRHHALTLFDTSFVGSLVSAWQFLFQHFGFGVFFAQSGFFGGCPKKVEKGRKTQRELSITRDLFALCRFDCPQKKKTHLAI